MNVEGRPLTTKWLLWMTSKRHILGFLSILWVLFLAMFLLLEVAFSLVVVSIFGKSRDQNTIICDVIAFQ